MKSLLITAGASLLSLLPIFIDLSVSKLAVLYLFVYIAALSTCVLIWGHADAGVTSKVLTSSCSAGLLLAMPNPWTGSGFAVEIPYFSLVPPACLVVVLLIGLKLERKT